MSGMAGKVQPPYSQLEKASSEVASAGPCRRWTLAAAACGLAGAAALVLAAAGGPHASAVGSLRGEVLGLEESRKCSSKFTKPKKPKFATELNGIRLDDVCIDDKPPYHVFIIGDWGGLKKAGKLTAVSHLNHRWNTTENFRFIWPTDEDCQFKVRDQMVNRAPKSKPAYVLNMGDNFYWGGVYDYCGAEDFTTMYSKGGTVEHHQDPVDQFKEIFEDIYVGAGLDGLMWLGVLGNHDWGGWRMDMAWDQAIGYTWTSAKTSKNRWMTPALYYYVTVRYHDFSVDYYFLDTNVWDALPYGETPNHNICGPHNPPTATCKPAGGPPQRADACKKWFEDLWEEQKVWLDKIVPESKAEWRVVVTHFPPYWGKHDWMKLAPKHEIDVVITGHRHSQNMHGPTDAVAKIWAEDKWNHEMNDFLDPTAWVVSGGGGGITSEHIPDTWGHDDQYGFVDMTLSKKKLKFEMISHGGEVRRAMEIDHYYSHGGLNEVVKIVKPSDKKKKKAEAEDKKANDKKADDKEADDKSSDKKKKKAEAEDKKANDKKADEKKADDEEATDK